MESAFLISLVHVSPEPNGQRLESRIRITRARLSEAIRTAECRGICATGSPHAWPVELSSKSVDSSWHSSV
eukprot:7180426-Alexandrium_andersonii.AAC.1